LPKSAILTWNSDSVKISLTGFFCKILVDDEGSFDFKLFSISNDETSSIIKLK